MAPVMVWVVLTGMPKCDAMNSVMAPLVFGAEAAERRELGDALAHGLHDAPPARQRAQCDRRVRAEDHPNGNDVCGRQVQRADGEVHERRSGGEQQSTMIPIVFCASLVPWPRE